MGNHVRRAAMIGAFLVLCLSANGGRPVNAAVGEPDQVAQQRADEDARYAAKFGTTVEEAAARYADRALVDDALSVVTGKRAAEFTGVYFVHTASAYTLHIVAKAGSGAMLELPKTKTLQVVYDDPAPRSWAELFALENEIGQVKGVVAADVNVYNGTVDVSAPDEVMAQLAARYGDSITVQPFVQPVNISCSSRTNCDDPRGGPQLNDSTAGLQCTAGAVAKGNATGAYKLISAGHCGAQGDNSIAIGILPGYDVGDIAWNGAQCNHIFNGCPSGVIYDVLKISCGSACDGPRNCVWYASSAFGNCWTHTGVKGSCCMNIGDVVDAMGWSDGPNSDQITHVNNLFGPTCIGCNTIHGFQTDHCYDRGNSGGPAYDGDKFWGVASSVDHDCGSGGTATNYVFANNGTSLESIQLALDVTICITSSC